MSVRKRLWKTAAGEERQDKASGPARIGQADITSCLTVGASPYRMTWHLMCRKKMAKVATPNIGPLIGQILDMRRGLYCNPLKSLARLGESNQGSALHWRPDLWRRCAY
jgi:hypothetical protein